MVQSRLLAERGPGWGRERQGGAGLGGTLQSPSQMHLWTFLLWVLLKPGARSPSCHCPPRLVLGLLHASQSQLPSLCTSFCKIIEAAEMSYFCGRDGLRGSAWPCPAAPWLQKVLEALYLACSEIHPSFILEGFRILSFSQCPLGQKRESQTIRAKRYLSDHL